MDRTKIAFKKELWTYNKELGRQKFKSEYLKEETSFIIDTDLPTISLMIGHQYLSLEVECYHHSIIGVSGFFRLDLCEKKKISKINPKTDLFVKANANNELMCGTGYDYIIDNTALFDPDSKRVFLGHINSDTEIIAINENVIVGLIKGKIVSVQIEHISF